MRALRRIVVCGALLLGACAPAPSSREGFELWLAQTPTRQESFARFEALLAREEVAGVVETFELWRADWHTPECLDEPYAIPPEESWDNIVPALRYVRDHVEPIVGEVEVVSAYRDPAYNECVGGAPQSRHKSFHAMDMIPRDGAIGREELIERLCPAHAREGRRGAIGLGIYRARRFHIDARGFRGWGENYHGDTFPCAARRSA